MNCKDCIHKKVCVIRGFPSAFENTRWEKEPCDHFESKTEWISVDERLPEKSGDYLTYHNGVITALMYSKRHKLFNAEDTLDEKFSKANCIEVSHWMPLPQPPKMRKEGEGK